ncbi:MAG TPA: cation transporter [Firmicutes bacterium]|nr:cation transporter [Bacillota bacterium]
MAINRAPYSLPPTAPHKANTWRYAYQKRTLWIVLVLNYLVSALKLGVGIWTQSTAIIADGLHSLADGSSNLLALIGIQLANKPPDRCHPYGHGKYETLAAMGIAGLLLGMAWEVTRAVWVRFRQPVALTVGFPQLGVMFLTMMINGLVSRYERKIGLRLASEALLADAAHTRTDLYISGTVAFGLVAARLGYPWMDLSAAVVIIILIVRTAVGIMSSNSRVLCDAAVLDPHEVKAVAQSIDGVTGCHAIRTRGRTSELYLDMHIEVAGDLDLERAHDLSHQVALALSRHFSHLAEVLIHVEPSRRGHTAQEAVYSSA